MKCYVVDAFAEKVFEGNPAAVCILNHWIPDSLMQNIAIENNLSETAFAVKDDKQYRLRWFTPGGEVDLCGHATLATAYVLFRFFETEKTEVFFQTKSGLLSVQKKGDLYEMALPAYQLTPVSVTSNMEQAIGTQPVEAWMGRDLVCILAEEEQVVAAVPDARKVEELDGLLLHITAKGKEYDCVSRSFGPKLRVPEDPVCGSGHCHMVPLWAEKLNQKDIHAYQASARGGALYCRMEGPVVHIAGKAVLYSINELHVPAT